MHNYSHKKLAELITQVDELPSDQAKFAEWSKRIRILLSCARTHFQMRSLFMPS